MGRICPQVPHKVGDRRTSELFIQGIRKHTTYIHYPSMVLKKNIVNCIQFRQVELEVGICCYCCKSLSKCRSRLCFFFSLSVHCQLKCRRRPVFSFSFRGWKWRKWMTKKNSTKGAAKQEIDLMLSCYCCTQNNACNAKNVMQLIQLSFDRYIIILYDCSCD